MSAHESSTAPRPFETFVFAASGFSAALAILCFLGWALDIPLLTSFSATSPAMQPLTAVMIGCGSAALIAVLLDLPVVRSIALITIFVIASVTLHYYLTGASLELNRWLFWDNVSKQPFYEHPGWPGSATSIAAILFACSLAFVGNARWAVNSSVPATLGMAYAFQALLSNMFSAEHMLDAFYSQSMAVPTAAAMISLCAAALLLNAQNNWVGTLLAPGAIPRAARQLLVIVTVVTIAINWAGWRAATQGSIPGLFLPPLLTAGAVLVLAAVILRLTSRLMQTDAARSAAEAELSFLMREMVHRCKNILSVVQSIGAQTISNGATPAESRQKFADRISAYGRSIDLVASHSDGAPLGRLVEEHLMPFVGQGGERLHTTGPRLVLKSEAAQHLGMALHELATNAAKYGALSNASGRIDVTWTVASNAPSGILHISWTETGGPPVVPSTSKGFGTQVIERMLKHALEAEVVTSYHPTGLAVELRIPLAGVTIQ